MTAPQVRSIIKTLICRCSSMVECQLPKLNTRVRFPSSAPKIQRLKTSCNIFLYYVENYTLFKAHWACRTTHNERTKGKEENEVWIHKSKPADQRSVHRFCTLQEDYKTTSSSQHLPIKTPSKYYPYIVLTW